MKSAITQCAAMTALLVSLVPAHAATIHDESIDGDLNEFQSVSPWISPGTPIGTLSVGSNVIVGQFGDDGAGNRDTDVYTVVVPNGFQLDAIDMDLTVVSGSVGGGSYFSIASGSDLGTGIPSVGANLDDGLYSGSGDLLAMFAGDTYSTGLPGVTIPLGAGTYTLGMSEINAIIDFEVDLQVSAVPLPAAGWLLGSAVLAMVGLGRRARRSRPEAR